MVKLLMFSVLWGMRTTGVDAAARSLYTNTKSRSSPAAAPAALVTAGCRLLAAAPWMPRTRSRAEVLHFNHPPSCIALTDADADTHSDGDSLGYRLVIAGHPRLSFLPPPYRLDQLLRRGNTDRNSGRVATSPPRPLPTAAPPRSWGRCPGEALLAQFHRNYGINNGQ